MSLLAPTELRVWRAEEVTWGETLCDAPACAHPAELLYDFDGERDEGVPLCCRCADLLTARWLATLTGAGYMQLPDLWQRDERPPRRRPPVDPAVWERRPEDWLREQGWFGEGGSFDPDWDIPF